MIIKFIINYTQACAPYNHTLLKLKQINSGTTVQQGGVLSPTLFNIYISDILLPSKDEQITTYVNDITITVFHTKHRKAQQLIQPYLQKKQKWLTTNNLYTNTYKTTTTLFTLNQTEYGTTLSLKLNNQKLPTTKHPKIFGFTLDPKLTFKFYKAVLAESFFLVTTIRAREVQLCYTK